MTTIEKPAGTTFDEIAAGVFAYVQSDGGWCLNNAAVLTDDGHTAVVDTAATTTRAGWLRALTERAAGAPARLVVDTHFHGDHTFGNCVFRPEAVVVAHERARDESAAAGLHMRELWPHVRWGEIELVLPEVTYSDRMVLHLGGLTAELHHPGPAHTNGDTVVWVPQRSVLVTGDIVMNEATPFCLMGSVSGSLRAIGRLRAFGAATVVPGHGPVGGPELLDRTEDYLRWVQQVAADGVRRGLQPLELASGVDLGRFAGWRDPERIVGNLHRAYAELDGAPEGAPLDALTIMQEMAALHGGPLPCAL